MKKMFMHITIAQLLLLVGISMFMATPKAFAQQCPSGLTNACGATCVDCRQPYTGATFCACFDSSGTTPGNTSGDNPFGAVTNPLPTNSTAPGGGLVILLNNVLRLIFVVAGIFAFLRIVIAGVNFIGAGGDPKKIESAWSSIWQSLLGLIIIISSFAIAALMGQLLFGDPGAILNPVIYGPLS